MKAVVAAFNQEKALVGAFSVILQLHRWIDLRHYSTVLHHTQPHSLDNWQPPQRRSLGQLVPRSFSFALAYSFSLMNSSEASSWPSLPGLRSACGQTWLHSPLYSLVLAVTRRLPVLSRGSQFITMRGCSGHCGYQGDWGMLLPSHDIRHRQQANNN